MTVLNRLLNINRETEAEPAAPNSPVALGARYPNGNDFGIVVSDAKVAKALVAKKRRKAEEFNLAAIRPQVGATGARPTFGLRANSTQKR